MFNMVKDADGNKNIKKVP